MGKEQLKNGLNSVVSMHGPVSHVSALLLVYYPIAQMGLATVLCTWSDVSTCLRYSLRVHSY